MPSLNAGNAPLVLYSAKASSRRCLAVVSSRKLWQRRRRRLPPERSFSRRPPSWPWNPTNGFTCHFAQCDFCSKPTFSLRLPDTLLRQLESEARLRRFTKSRNSRSPANGWPLGTLPRFGRRQFLCRFATLSDPHAEELRRRARWQTLRRDGVGDIGVWALHLKG